MLNTWLAVTMGMAAALPSTHDVAHNARDVVNALRLHDMKVIVRPVSETLNASPFIVRSSHKTCLIHVNRSVQARVVWTAFMADENESMRRALTDFAVAHEMGHCVLTSARERNTRLPAFHRARPPGPPAPLVVPREAPQARVIRVSTVVHYAPGLSADHPAYDEVFADLVGLHYVQMVSPHLFSDLMQRLRTVRTEFAVRDNAHASAAYLTDENLRRVAALVAKPVH